MLYLVVVARLMSLGQGAGFRGRLTQVLILKVDRGLRFWYALGAAFGWGRFQLGTRSSCSSNASA